MGKSTRADADSVGSCSRVLSGIRDSTRRRAFEVGRVVGGRGAASNGGGGVVGAEWVTAVIRRARAVAHVTQAHPKERSHTSRERSRISALAVRRSPVRRLIALSCSVGTIGGENVSEGKPVGRCAESDKLPPNCGKAQTSAGISVKSSYSRTLPGANDFRNTRPSPTMVFIAKKYPVGIRFSSNSRYCEGGRKEGVPDLREGTRD